MPPRSGLPEILTSFGAGAVTSESNLTQATLVGALCVFTGYDKIDLKAARDLNIVVTNVPTLRNSFRSVPRSLGRGQDSPRDCARLSRHPAGLQALLLQCGRSGPDAGSRAAPGPVSRGHASRGQRVPAAHHRRDRLPARALNFGRLAEGSIRTAFSQAKPLQHPVNRVARYAQQLGRAAAIPLGCL